MIVLKDVSKSYSTGSPAIKQANIEIEDGEFVFIVGNSGSGKSTLIKLLKSNQLENLTIMLNTKILQMIKRSRYLKKSLLEDERVSIIEISDEPKLFLTFSKDFMTLTLFFKDAHYDDSQIIVDKHKSAIKWSENLFKNICEENYE